MFETFVFVLIPMIISALLGWWLGGWMKERRYEDVTESYDELRSKTRGKPAVVPLTKADLDDRIASLSSSVAAIPRPNFDPLEKRLKDIESAVTGFTVPETDMTPIYERMTRIDQRLAHQKGVETVEGRLSKIEGTLESVSRRVAELQNTDLGPLQTRFTTLESNLQGLKIEAPEVDLGPLQSNIAQLELAVAELDLPQTDLSPILEQLTGLELRVVDLAEAIQDTHGKDLETINSELLSLSSSFTSLEMPEMPSLDPVEQRLTNIERAVSGFQVPEMDFAPVEERLLEVERAVSGIHVPVTDLDPLHVRLERLEQQLLSPNQDYQTLFARLAGMEAAIDALDRDPVDFTPLQSRMMNLENALGAMRSEIQGATNSEQLERQIIALQQSIRAIPQPDLSPMVGSLRSIDSRLDMAAMENRLTAIEYGLTAVHHMLRSRQDTPAPVSQIEPELYANAAKTQVVTETYAQPVVTTSTTTQSYTATLGADPIAAARRPDDKSNLLLSAAFGEADDLERISGVGPMLSEMLNNIGVYYFWQVAEWDAEDIVWVDDKLEHFKGRIERDNWVGQAIEFAAEPQTASRP